VSTFNELIEFRHHDNAAWVSSRAVLCLRDEMVDSMNDRILDDVFRQHDGMFQCRQHCKVDQQAVYPTEYMNSSTRCGLPPY